MIHSLKSLSFHDSWGFVYDRRKTMNLHRLAIIVIPILSVVIGCSGNTGKLINQSPVDSKTTQKELIDNWSDYHVKYRHDANVIVFDLKNDDREILAGGKGGGVWVAIQDQEGWAKFVKDNITGDDEIIITRFDARRTGVREIWGPDNQLYGFIIAPQKDGCYTRVVDENTLRLRYDRRRTRL